MKSAAFAIALLAGSAAFAQAAAPGSTAYEGDGVTAPFESEAAAGTIGAVPVAATGATAQPGNAEPARDARGIAVISAPAIVPPGYNGIPAAAMGGPLLDADTGAPVAATVYPACSATITDRCLQTYERGRR
ncbi:MAG: hypothetical protein QOI38_841 [Sphingomonadales bacterium]|jgi:hypothetical protein|nr:hypothetical protein [Sphingomonadales bacterium]